MFVFFLLLVGISYLVPGFAPIALGLMVGLLWWAIGAGTVDPTGGRRRS